MYSQAQINLNWSMISLMVERPGGGGGGGGEAAGRQGGGEAAGRPTVRRGAHQALIRPLGDRPEGSGPRPPAPHFYWSVFGGNCLHVSQPGKVMMALLA